MAMAWIEYIPILTSIFSIFFLGVIFRHWQRNPKPYLLWWTIGVLTFGFGTATESINVLFGWSAVNFRLWYISGALLGGFPLAQGSVYLLMNKKFADWSTIIILTIIVAGSISVLFSPLEIPIDFEGKLNGSVLAWKWTRFFSPFVNIYAFIFLVGGAVYSAIIYFRQQRQQRFLGNVYIAIGALLPGIGGSFTRAGYVNVLFVTELIGLVMIYFGYRIIRKDKAAALTLVS